MWHTGIASNMNFPAPVAVLGFLGCSRTGVEYPDRPRVLLFLRKARWLRGLAALVGLGAFL